MQEKGSERQKKSRTKKAEEKPENFPQRGQSTGQEVLNQKWIQSSEDKMHHQSRYQQTIVSFLRAGHCYVCSHSFPWFSRTTRQPVQNSLLHREARHQFWFQAAIMEEKLCGSKQQLTGTTQFNSPPRSTSEGFPRNIKKGTEYSGT